MMPPSQLYSQGNETDGQELFSNEASQDEVMFVSRKLAQTMRLPRKGVSQPSRMKPGNAKKQAKGPQMQNI